ncbi:MAG TPA: flagellar biosynthesis protein FlhF [Acidobacteriota bacterium]|nr:flagellar biosynthesis protein FlhF [Acidobacteriota bacterium]
MKIKTYHNHSVTKALEQIKKDLGSDAVILSTKRTKTRGMLGLMPKVAYEITAASEAQAARKDGGAAVATEGASNGVSRLSRSVDSYEVADGPPRAPSKGPAQHSKAALKRPSGGDGPELKPQLERLAAELEKLKRLVGRRQSLAAGEIALNFKAGANPEWKQSEEAAAEMARLVVEGIDRDLAHSLLRFALRERSREGKSEAPLRPYLRQAVRRMVQTAPIDFEKTRTAIFVGPTGVGKTTTIAKLAAVFALGEQKRVELITLDTYRIAAAEQLRTYADIIGVPIRVVSGIEELDRAIQEASARRDCVFIDTTGHSHKQAEDMAALSSFLRRRSDIEKHLVLSITTKSDDLREIIEAFGEYAPDKLVFTKLDETSTYGSIAGEVILSGMPLSYLTNGQAVPDDIQVPTPQFVSELVIPD